MAERPEAPTLFDRWFRPGVVSDYKHDRGLYDTQEKIRIGQQMSPTAGTTLGQVSNLSGLDPETIAHPSQYTSKQTTEPSSVPSYRFMPTMTNAPEVQGPYDIRQNPDVDGRSSPITQHYPAPGPSEQPMEPQLRQMTAPLGGPRETAQGPTYAPEPMGTMTPQPRPDVQYNKPGLDLDQPATLYQQSLASSGLERETKWPRLYGSGGAGAGGGQFQQKLQARKQAYENMGLPADQALARAQFDLTTGDPDSQQLKRDLDQERINKSEADRGLNERKFQQKQAQDAFMNDWRNRSLGLRSKADERMQNAMDSKDMIAIARLNEQRHWHDQLSLFANSIDKAGVHSDEEKEAMRQAMSVIEQLDQRDPTPQELSLFEKYLGGPRPRYSYKPRPPIQGGAPTNGVAPPMQRPSTGAPGPQAAPKGKAPVAVQSDEDYEKLPSGTTFTGPDGKTRTKP